MTNLQPFWNGRLCVREAKTLENVVNPVGFNMPTYTKDVSSQVPFVCYWWSVSLTMQTRDDRNEKGKRRLLLSCLLLKCLDCPFNLSARTETFEFANERPFSMCKTIPFTYLPRTGASRLVLDARSDIRISSSPSRKLKMGD